jgi:hypothetical protein
LDANAEVGIVLSIAAVLVLARRSDVAWLTMAEFISLVCTYGAFSIRLRYPIDSGCLLEMGTEIA